MQDINATITISSNTTKQKEEVKININNDSIWYFENDNNKTIAIFNLKELTLERDNNEIYLKYNFIEHKETNNNILQIKSLNTNTTISIYTKEIIKSYNCIKIVYIIEQDEFIYEINIDKSINKQIL